MINFVRLGRIYLLFLIITQVGGEVSAEEPTVVTSFPSSCFDSQLNDINQLGVAVGRAEVFDAAKNVIATFSFIRSGKSVSIIPADHRYRQMECTAISDTGCVVGRVYSPIDNSSHILRAFSYEQQDCSFALLPCIEGTATSIATSVSNDGTTIAGVCGGRPCVWQKSEGHWRVNTLSNFELSSLSVVMSNDGNTAVAAASLERANYIFLWARAGGMWQEKERIQGALSPLDVNNFGVVVGAKSNMRGGQIKTRGFLIKMLVDKMVIEIPPLAGDNYSVARAINNHGLVVGWSDTPGSDATGPRSFTWKSGEQSELVLDSEVTWHQAYAINDQGDIAGLLERADAPYASEFILNGLLHPDN